MLIICDRLAARKKKKKKHPRHLFITHRYFIGSFLLTIWDWGNNRLQIYAVNYSHDPPAHPFEIFPSPYLSSAAFLTSPCLLAPRRAEREQALARMYIIGTLLSYQIHISAGSRGCKEQWGPDKSVALCSESRPDNRTIGRSIKPIISNLFMGD